MMAPITELYPEYSLTSSIDTLRSEQYAHLDEKNHTYLDYTGSGLASASQLAHSSVRLSSTLYGNPHSINPSSQASTEAINVARVKVLQHLSADAEEYDVIFTANATGAARLIGESYSFTRGRKLVLTADNHNSVNGLREFAGRKGSNIIYIPISTPDLRINDGDVMDILSPAREGRTATLRTGINRLAVSLMRCLSSRKSRHTITKGSYENGMKRPSMSDTATTDKTTSFDTSTRYKATPHWQSLVSASKHTSTRLAAHEKSKDGRGLFAYPAQSNFTSVRHPLSWVSLAQRRGYDVLLDAAAYLPTASLDMSVIKPEFLIISWYKLFGFPTGVGCLVVKKEALSRLERPWFSGGTIQATTVGVPWHLMAKGPEGFEDGTVNFLGIPDIMFGLEWINAVGLGVIGVRVRCLTGWFLKRLAALRHSDGTPMAKTYGPQDVDMRGGTVAFNLLDRDGKVVDERLVGQESAAARISLRTGCFCNPGAGEASMGLDVTALRRLANAKTLMRGMDDFIEVLGLPSAGAIRVSFGIASTAADVDKFFDFVEKTYRDRVTSSEGLAPRDSC
ncbi:pyridoxal phosphate-dependent transferase [Triangularia setosa]|uniref:Pyridoxal phosphate-dependent transferase n=1 Tax=Triangularia setosa TaxID=2587417 RepID=A0AAN6W157_9PEZI|nr:pyridoxal phosphate-dependent transferase [Podospora setosa]